MNLSNRVLVALVLAIPAWSAAQGVELPLADDFMTGEPKTGVLPLGHSSLAGVRLNRTSIEQVRSLFGPTEVFRVSNSDGANKAVCYVSSKVEDTTAVIFESGALGAWEVVTAITVAPRHLIRGVESRCVKSAKITSHLSTKGGLKLSLPSSRLASLGLPHGAIDSRGITEFRFLKDQPLRKSPSSKKAPDIKQVSSGALVALIQGKVQWFQVYWTESI